MSEGAGAGQYTYTLTASSFTLVGRGRDGAEIFTVP